ncbi:unnamed protein product [Clonostachys rhizophaga]|uniref:Uncharacterized protein n=1 Tax=Clonostachys rhizophaga TaxID=160324 RepID=A0A9N9W460_9HYPO|nr:unnamed protein product [Clonostachys rhizophaga]
MAPELGHYTDKVFCEVPVVEYLSKERGSLRFCGGCKGFLIVEMLRLLLTGSALPSMATDSQTQDYLWFRLGPGRFPGLKRMRRLFSKILSHVETELTRGLCHALGEQEISTVIWLDHKETLQQHLESLETTMTNDTDAWLWIKRFGTETDNGGERERQDDTPRQVLVHDSELLEKLFSALDALQLDHTAVFQASLTLAEAETKRGLAKAHQDFARSLDSWRRAEEQLRTADLKVKSAEALLRQEEVIFHENVNTLVETRLEE